MENKGKGWIDFGVTWLTFVVLLVGIIFIVTMLLPKYELTARVHFQTEVKKIYRDAANVILSVVKQPASHGEDAISRQEAFLLNVRSNS